MYSKKLIKIVKLNSNFENPTILSVGRTKYCYSKLNSFITRSKNIVNS